MEWPRSTIMYTFDKLMQIIVTFGFFTLDDDMMSCVVQSDISVGNIVFFCRKKYFEYCFCLSTFSPIVYRPAQSYLQTSQ